MKRAFILGLILLFTACEKDYSPTKPTISTEGTIQIIIADKSVPAANIPDSLDTVKKPAKPARLDQLEVRVLKSDNSVLASEIFTPSNGDFQVSMTVEAQNDLKVLCLGTFNGDVGYFGVDEDVDVQAGKTTTATIIGWNDSYIPRITSISPNPSTDGSYTVTWNNAPNATSYVLQEAANQQFSGAVASYSTTSLEINISGKAAGTCYYRVQASSEYNIKSGWSLIESTVVQNTHTISGTVSGADGMTVTLSGDASEIQTVNDGETYSFTVAEGGSYTVTPSKKGYSFTPPVQTFNNVTSSHTRDFSGAQDSYTISGTVTGADGVMVILGGGASGSKTVDDGGTYSFTVGGGGSYTVTPFKTDYLFDPASSSFTEIISNQTQNFTGTSSARTYTLSGTVSGADGVIITLIGDASGSLVVNDGGSYSFTVAEGGNYTITPSKTGFTFTPASRIFNNVTSNQIQNFAANVITYIISGTVSGTDGVTITLSGNATDSQVVNDGGSYSFTVAEGGNYTITPSKSGFTFTPASRTFNNVTSNQTQNFDANVITYAISGTVSGADGVTVSLSGDKEQSLVIDDGGTYSFIVEYGGNYTVTPYKLGFTFFPDSKEFNNVTSDKTQNFIIETEYPISVSQLVLNGIDNDGTNWWVSGTYNGIWRLYKVASDRSTILASYYLPHSTDPLYIEYINEVAYRDGYVYVRIHPKGPIYKVNPSNGFYTTSSYSTRIWNYDMTFMGSTLWQSNGDDIGHNHEIYSSMGTEFDFTAVPGWKCITSDGTYLYLGIYGHDKIYKVTTSGQILDTFTVMQADQPRRISYLSSENAIYSVTTNSIVKIADIVHKTYTISGTVSGADGVTISLSGDTSDSLTVNDGGSYSFTVTEGGSYTVTPTKSGYTFTPISQTFTNITANQKLNFIASPIIVSSEITMVSIPAGSFEMGSNSGDTNEKPVHPVILDAFEMSATEITQGQYKSITGSNPSYFSGSDDLPVEEVSWYDAVKFCNLLSDKTGLDRCYDENTWECDFKKNGFRLPTEAEWEYACRAGTETKYYTGDTESDLARAGWYSGNSGGKTQPIGQKEPNAWGLYDIYGNVWEWCNDWYDSGYYSSSPSTNPAGPSSGSHRVLRGGSFIGYCGLTYRSRDYPSRGDRSMGFRVVRRP